MGSISSTYYYYIGGISGYASDWNYCYYLDSCAGSYSNLLNECGVDVDEDTLASGYIADILQYYQSQDEYGEESKVWGQAISGNNTNPYPVLGGATIYRISDYFFVNETELLSSKPEGKKTKAELFILDEGSYTVVFADYENGELVSADYKDITVTDEDTGIMTVTSNSDITLGTHDKIMLFDNMNDITPMCEALTVQ